MTLFYKLVSSCSDGCLKCSHDETCLVCDVENFYYLLDNKCIYFRPDYCLFALKLNECLICKQEFYLDRGRCIRTPVILPNCFQANMKECIVCNNGYYIFKGKCIRISNVIPNCEIQINEYQCRKCHYGYVLNNQEDECLDKDYYSHSRNCALLSGLQCEQYIEEYQGFYLNHKFLKKNMLDNFFHHIFRKKKNSIDIKMQAIYEQIVVSRKENLFKIFFLAKILQFSNYFKESSPFCEYFITQNKFFNKKYSELQPLYPLTKNKLENHALQFFEENENKFEYFKGILCQKDFIIAVPNCKRYINNTDCAECNFMYYLTNNECQLHNNIANCIKYSKFQANNCDQCDQEFYSSAGSCVARTVSNPQCVLFDPFSENCIQCEENFQLSINKLNCLTVPNNCMKIDENSNRCVRCKPHFYLDITTFLCFMPIDKIDKCLIYKDSLNCLGCEEGFILENNKCIQSHVVTSLNSYCINYTFIDNIKSCSECTNGYFPIRINQICVSSPIHINNCKNINEAEECIECFPGFYLNSGKCYQTLDPLCEENVINQNICQKCSFDQTFKVPNNLNLDNKCIDLQPIIKQMCASLDLNIASSYFPCQACYHPHILYKKETTNHSFCVAKFQLEHMDDNIEQHCELMEISENKTSKCRRCKINPKTGKRMVIYNGRCMDYCPMTTMIIKTYDINLNSWFICTERNDKKLMNCKDCKCKRFDDGIFVDSFLSLAPIDNSKFYTFDEMKLLLKNHYTYSNLIENYYSCVECPNGYKPVIDTFNNTNTQTYSKLDYRPQNKLTYFYKNEKSYFSEFNYIPQIHECHPYGLYNFDDLPENHSIVVKDIYNIYLKVDYTFFFNSLKDITINNFDFCKAVKKSHNGKVGCFSCEFGYNGYIFYSDVEKINYLPECFYFYECRPEIYYKNAFDNAKSSDLFYLLFCHQCKSLDQIITISTYPINYESLYEGFDPRVYDVNLTSLSMNFCFKAGIFDSNPDFPQNCAVQEIIFAILSPFDLVDPEDNNPVCRLCQPKYKPTYYERTTDQKNYILSCEFITECKESDEFNRCSQCNTGFVLKYDPIPSLSYRQHCIPNNVENCEISHNDTNCLKCLDGFELLQSSTLGDKCINQVNYYCNIGYTLMDDFFMTGCNKCFENFYSSVLPYENLHLCYNSDEYLTENCLISDHNNKCIDCFPNHFPLTNSLSCIFGTIKKCIEYSDNSTCQKCQEGYYLNSNECVKGNINNCLEYLSKQECSLCEKNYFLYKVNNTVLCLSDFNLVSNCIKYDIDNSVFPPIYSCTQCDVTYKTKQISEIVNCRNYVLDLLCKEFDDQGVKPSTNLPSIPVCIECIEEAFILTSTNFLSSSNCVQRKNYPIYRCEQYDLHNDECKLCEPGFFLNYNNSECLNEQFQTHNCIITKNNLSCYICKEGFFFDGDACIPLNAPLPNCFLHLNETECFICNENFLMKEGSCITFDMTDETHKSIKCENLLTNPDLIGNSLRNELLLNSCFENLIHNCNSYDIFGNCTQCSQGYYLSQFYYCEEVFTPIEYCEFYSSADKCLVCSSGFSPSKDQKFCLKGMFEVTDFMVNNCEKYNRKEYCILCEPGYQLDLKTDTCSWSLQENHCQLIDYDGKCLICQSGYQMNVEGLCLPNEHHQNNVIAIELQEE